MTVKKIAALFILLLLAVGPKESFAAKESLSLPESGEQPCRLLKDAPMFLTPGSHKIGLLKSFAKVIKNKHDITWSRVIIDAWVERKALQLESGDPVTYTKRKRTYFYSSPGKEKGLIGYYNTGTELALFPELGEDAVQGEWLRVIASGWVLTRLLQKYSEPPIPTELEPLGTAQE